MYLWQAADYVPAAGAEKGSWPAVVGPPLGTLTVTGSPAAAAGINGQPSVLTDGVDDMLGAGDTGTLFLAGSRPYLAMVIRAETAGFTGPFGEVFVTYRLGGFVPFAFYLSLATGTLRFRPTFHLQNSPSIFTAYDGGPVDTQPHILEMMLPDSLDGHVFIDGVECATVLNGAAFTSPLLVDMSSITLGRKPDSTPGLFTRCVNMHYGAVLGLKSIPSPADRARIYRWLEYVRDGD